MQIPFFYSEQFPNEGLFTLPEETSKHVVQVLRMQEGERIRLTDGKGNAAIAAITGSHKKHCGVRIESYTQTPRGSKAITIAISILKNTSRFEWFVEKATEIGVSAIVVLKCDHTVKTHFREDRIKGIAISAMLQSQQSWLPEIESFSFAAYMQESFKGEKYIAHCAEDASKIAVTNRGGDAVMLIGPEGDFSPSEINLAIEKGFKPATLGDNRLRTETAGIVAATLLCIQ